MEFRQLGQTGLNVSIAGFGASPLGNVFAAIDEAECQRAIHYAIDEGINFFDVSPYYGMTLAESRLGKGLLGYRHRIVLATKCGRYGQDVFDFSATRIESSIDESLQRLHTDYVDLLQVHDVEFGDLPQIVNETLPALRRVQASGKARYIGITGYSLKALEQIAAQAPVDSILTYCRYNLFAGDAAYRLVPFAQKRQIGLINASPLHMGLLGSNNVPAWHPAPLQVRDAASRIDAVCRAHGRVTAEVAMRFCFDNSAMSTTLVGLASKLQVASVLRSMESEKDEELLRQITEIVAPVYNHFWPSGKTENQDTSVDINEEAAVTHEAGN